MVGSRDFWERDGLAGRRHPSHPAVSAYVASRVRELSHHLELTAGTRVLDVGCGNGFFTFHFDGLCDVWGVDYSKRMLSLNPVKKCVLSDASNLCFKDGSFDVVFCHALLHHVDDSGAVLSEMKRVSKKHVVVLEPNRNNPLMSIFSLIVAQERGALRFSLSYLKRMVQEAGLTVRASFSFGASVANKMPVFLVPLIRLLDFRQPLGITNFVVAEKTSD
ncbi:MAG: methyltransferase domain-containing protein [Candidatus Altiarchaeota archaeon]